MRSVHVYAGCGCRNRSVARPVVHAIHNNLVSNRQAGVTGTAMSTLISQACLLSFAALLLAVAVSDIRIQRIPNYYVLGIILLYPLFVLTAPKAIDWRAGLICFGAVLAAGFVLSSIFRIMGAGDAKLLAAAALWTDAKLIIPFLMITAVSGGLFVAYLLLRRYAGRDRPMAASPLADAALGADAGVTIGDMTMAGGDDAPERISVGTSTPEIGSNGGEDGSERTRDRFPMVLHTERHRRRRARHCRYAANERVKQ
jgi:Flp pilus assembly protein protease CpaA